MKSIPMKFVKIIIGIVLLVIYAAMIFVFMAANMEHYTAFMHSDIASEALLSTVIYEQGAFLPETWVVASAIHLITAPNLAALIYPLTGFNLQISMGIACCIMMIILQAVVFAYMRQIGFSNIEALAVLLIVLSLTKAQDHTQVMILLYAMDYVSHIITCFIMLMLYNHNMKKGKLGIFAVLLATGIAVINGFQGMHASLFLYWPLVGVEIVRQIISLIKKHKLTRWDISVWVCAEAVLTLLVNFFSAVYDPAPTRNIRHAFEKFMAEVVPALHDTVISGRLIVITVAILVMAAVGYAIAIGRLVKDDGLGGEQAGDAASSEDDAKAEDSKVIKPIFLWSTLCFPASAVIVFILTTFTTSLVASRYFIMLVYAVATGAMMLVRYFPSWVKAICGVVLAVYAVVAVSSFYKGLIVEDYSENSDFYKVYAWMRDNGYDYGYSTFDNANSITVMGNNTVKVRCVNNMYDMEGSRWLTDVSWYPPMKDPSGETCYVVSDANMEDFKGFLKRFNPTIVREEDLGYFDVYVLDHDYTVWER